MSNNNQQQPQRLEPSTQRVFASQIAGNENANIQEGNQIVQKARIYGGKTYRFYALLDHLQQIGCNKAKLEVYRISVASGTKAFSSEVPPYGAIGESLTALIGSELPKKESVREGGTGILKRPEQPAQQPGGSTP